MGANAYYKKYVEKLVNANPTDIGFDPDNQRARWIRGVY